MGYVSDEIIEGSALILYWPSWAGNGRGGIDIDDDRTDGSTGWEDKPEDEIPDYIGDIDIDFLKRWI